MPELAAGWATARDDALGDPIPEPLLVALAAIHHCEPKWLVDAGDWPLIESGDIAKLLSKSAYAVRQDESQA